MKQVPKPAHEDDDPAEATQVSNDRRTGLTARIFFAWILAGGLYPFYIQDGLARTIAAVLIAGVVLLACLKLPG